MKRVAISMVLALIFQGASCQQKMSRNNSKKNMKDTVRYAPIDFYKYNSMGRIAAGVSGRLRFDVGINERNNFGEARVFLIHKDGAKKWVRDMNVKYRDIDEFDGKTNYGYLTGAKRLIREDSVLLKDFNAWAFFTDKKWLKKGYESGESGRPLAYYAPYENSEVEIILYQRLAGEKRWVEIGRRKYKTDEYGGEIDDDYWESNFIKQKLKESNAQEKKEKEKENSE